MDGTGGIITDLIIGDSTYKVHTFLSGTEVFTAPDYGSTLEVLVVAGGGGGGGNAGGGGGAGGVQIDTEYAYTALQEISVTVGASVSGGVGSLRGSTGNNSSFGTITALGGGSGGGYNQSVGGDGGSGGGGGCGTPKTGGTGSQGSNGGTGVFTGDILGGGGGGGYSENGYNTIQGQAGHGGAGYQSDINGTNSYYAAGGGGGGYVDYGEQAGVGGSSIGGNGGYSGGQSGSNGTINTGSGGGGGAAANGAGGNGSSGVVILRYLVISEADVTVIGDRHISRHSDNVSSSRRQQQNRIVNNTQRPQTSKTGISNISSISKKSNKIVNSNIHDRGNLNYSDEDLIVACVISHGE